MLGHADVESGARPPANPATQESVPLPQQLTWGVSHGSPDAIAWAHGAGANSRLLIEPVIDDVTELRP